MNVFLYLYCMIGDRSLITQVYYFYRTVFFTDLESVYHILQILIFFMIITLVTTDLPNISGFVGSSLLHIYSISSLRGFRLFCTHRPSP